MPSSRRSSSITPRFVTTELGWSNLVGCAFTGVVHGLHLGRRPIDDHPADWTLTSVDLSAARPRDLQLIGVDLGVPGVDIRLPDDQEHWVIHDWPAFLHRAAALVDQLPPGDDQITASIWLDYARRDSGARQRTGFVAVWDLNHLGGPALTTLLQQAR